MTTVLAKTTAPPSAAKELLVWAAHLDDIERLRIATENRARSLHAEGVNVDLYEQQATALERIEHEATLALQRAVRAHPLGPWIKNTIGLGEKQGARLIAAIGSISRNECEGRMRRGPAELWAYCGYVPGQRRARGQKANWSAQAKMRAWLCAESCIKQARSPYRAVYDNARAKHAEALHDEPCVRCGPSGHPAAAGSALSDGHKHARALREVAKAILRDLFLEAREVGA